MTAPLPSETPTSPPPTFPEIEFGRSIDGFPVARVADTAFAMLPGHNCRYYLASGSDCPSGCGMAAR
jgi:hypothetical protein